MRGFIKKTVSLMHIIFEISYVIIGIVIAFQIEKFFNEQKQKKYYNATIVNLKQDLSDDLIECKLNKSLNEKPAIIIDSILNAEWNQSCIGILNSACVSTILLNKLNDKNELISMEPDVCPNISLRRKLIDLVETKYNYIKDLEKLTITLGIDLRNKLAASYSNKTVNEKEIKFLCINYLKKIKYLISIYQITIKSLEDLLLLVEKE